MRKDNSTKSPSSSAAFARSQAIRQHNAGRPEPKAKARETRQRGSPRVKTEEEEEKEKGKLDLKEDATHVGATTLKATVRS